MIRIIINTLAFAFVFQYLHLAWVKFTGMLLGMYFPNVRYDVNNNKPTIDYNWNSKVCITDKQVKIAESIKPLLTGLTEQEFNDVFTCLKEQLF